MCTSLLSNFIVDGIGYIKWQLVVKKNGVQYYKSLE
jgi:hypothetical protein